MQGGASTQFAMVPMNFLPAGGKADYIVTGSWSKKAVKEAQKTGTIQIAATTESVRNSPATVVAPAHDRDGDRYHHRYRDRDRDWHHRGHDGDWYHRDHDGDRDDYHDRYRDRDRDDDGHHNGRQHCGGGLIVVCLL